MLYAPTATATLVWCVTRSRSSARSSSCIFCKGKVWGGGGGGRDVGRGRGKEVCEEWEGKGGGEGRRVRREGGK